MVKAWQMLLVLAAVCLLPTATGCASSVADASSPASPSADPARYVLYMTHLVLRPQHPAHITFHVAAGGLRVVVNAERPLASEALEQVSALPASHPLGTGPVPLTAQSHSALGQTVYVLRAKQPLAAGWYRLELVGRGEIVQLSIEGH